MKNVLSIFQLLVVLRTAEVTTDMDHFEFHGYSSLSMNFGVIGNGRFDQTPSIKLHYLGVFSVFEKSLMRTSP